MNDFLPGMEPIEPPRSVPQNDQEWFLKRFHISELFSPTEPVREADMFVGRVPQIKQVTEGTLQGGQHIVIYGDRGVGKTSLVNVISNRIFSDVPTVHFFKVRCLTGYDFVEIWAKAFTHYRLIDGSDATDYVDSTLDANKVLRILLQLPDNIRPVFVFDEFDRVTDQSVKLQLAETIKLLSDEAPRATVMVVGVARTVRQLISEHESIRRAIRQIHMPPMSRNEVIDLIKLRLDKAGITIDTDAMETIIWLANGMPAFAHLLGMSAAKAAIDHRAIHITDQIAISSLPACINEVDETTREAYAKATQSARPNNQLREVLLACATTPHDDFGRFTAASVREPISKILRKPKDIPDYNRNLKAFCSEERGAILEREGSPNNYHYKFKDPLMQSYVLMKGVAAKMIRPNGH